VSKNSGKLGVRGAVREGVVVSTRPKKTAVVRIDYAARVPKYDRLEKRRSRIHAHVPEGVEVAAGDKVRFAECRKVSKTKAHVILEKVE